MSFTGIDKLYHRLESDHSSLFVCLTWRPLFKLGNNLRMFPAPILTALSISCELDPPLRRRSMSRFRIDLSSFNSSPLGDFDTLLTTITSASLVDSTSVLLDGQ